MEGALAGLRLAGGGLPPRATAPRRAPAAAAARPASRARGARCAAFEEAAAPPSRTAEVARIAAAPAAPAAPAAGAPAAAAGGAAGRGAVAPADLDALAARLKKAAKRLQDRVYYGDVFPPTGSFQLSYARLLELLAKRRVKRLVLLSDGRAAIAEVPVENTESDFATVTYDRADYNVQYAEEVPEWKMEKNRYYVELPGDAWAEGTLMRLVKAGQERRVWVDGQLRVPYDSLLRLNEVRPELAVMDPGDAYVWLNQYSTQFLPILGLLALRLVVGAGDWALRKLGRKKASPEEALAAELGAHKAKAYNLPEEAGKKGGKKGKGGADKAGSGAAAGADGSAAPPRASTRRDTGVRYEDVAGVDAIKEDVRVVLDILLGEEKFRAMGAHPVRGVLLEGPPGTGKTLLAKAMAGEAGIPFYSANGAEFVEMFQGVAAARIRSLFRAARKTAPSIVFIDEIDAIGKARGSGGSADSGSAEREQGLLQLLTEMDGFFQSDAVLVVAATNRAAALDEALLRPGRFDRAIHMGLPSAPNRLQILRVHARGKPVDRSDDDAALRAVADLAIGYSGAELANLLNEAAILGVRRDAPTISLEIMKEAMDKVKLGLPHAPLPDSPAKRRFAAVEAARAVAFALTPGLPPIEHVTIRPRGGAAARILFVPQEPRADGGTWHLLTARGARVNAVEIDRPMTPFQLACALLTPLYAARAAEALLFGPRGVTLLTAREVARAGELARWIAVDSKLHPGDASSPVAANMRMGGGRDPTTAWADASHDGAIAALQRGAAARAAALVRARRPVIEAVAAELCDSVDETVTGARLLELLATTPLAADAGAEAAAAAAAAAGAVAVAGGGAPAAAAAGAGADAVRALLGDFLATREGRAVVEVLLGRVEDWDLVPGGVARRKAEQVREQLLDAGARARLEAVARFAEDEAAPWPPAPPVPADGGPGLAGWSPPGEGAQVIEV